MTINRLQSHVLGRKAKKVHSPHAEQPNSARFERKFRLRRGATPHAVISNIACGDGNLRVRRCRFPRATMAIAACGDFGCFVRLLNFFQKKTASCFVVFGKVRTFASEKQNTMSDNYCITQACVGMAMPSGQHVCLFRIGSHSRCHF